MGEKQFRCKAEVDASFEAEKREYDGKPKTFKAKIENYWYHYKWHTVIGAFLAFVLVFGLVQCSLKENPDYTVITAFDRYIPSEVTNVIESELEKYGEDLNGDGKVIVHVYDVSSSDDRDTQTAQSTKLMSEMQRGEVMLLFVDDAYYDKLNALEVFDTDSTLFTDKDNTAVNLRYSDLTKKINEAYYEISRKALGSDVDFINNNYYVTKRVVSGTDFEKKEKSVQSEKDNIKMLKGFLDGLKFDIPHEE